jgi:alpha-galactosidase
MWADERKVFAANVPNRGSVPGLPDDAILEMPTLTTATGLRALQMTDLSEPLKAILSRKLAATRLTVQAALQGDRRLFVEALLVDGAVHGARVAQDLATELLSAQQTYLPQF